MIGSLEDVVVSFEIEDCINFRLDSWEVCGNQLGVSRVHELLPHIIPPVVFIHKEINLLAKWVKDSCINLLHRCREAQGIYAPGIVWLWY